MRRPGNESRNSKKERPRDRQRKKKPRKKERKKKTTKRSASKRFCVRASLLIPGVSAFGDRTSWCSILSRTRNSSHANWEKKLYISLPVLSGLTRKPTTLLVSRLISWATSDS